MPYFSRKFKILFASSFTLYLSIGILLNPANAYDPADLEKFRKTGDCVRCDLSRADLTEMNFVGIDLSSANLTGAILKNVRFGETFFDKANLTGADLSGTEGDWVFMIGANLSNANLTGARVSINFTDANLSGANLENVDLSDSILYRTILRGANLKGTKLPTKDCKEELKKGLGWPACMSDVIK